MGLLGCSPEHLRLELPETASMSTLEIAAPQLRTPAETGVALLIDDMGAGASSLRNLSTIPVSGMKIDRSFVNGMLNRDSDHAVVQMLTNLAVGILGLMHNAHYLGLRITAEAVETAEQEGELRRLGVVALQGHHVARPAPAPELRWV
jgi:EAL domain-containing protein (putative c-di-GMP-specific phosphodiesterase class I)